MSTIPLPDPLPCPFCGDTPSFQGDASRWRDDSRYVELSLGCCALMTEGIGWRRARDMTDEAKDSELRAVLTAKWNERAGAQQAPLDPKSDQGHLTGKLPCTCIYATAENTPSVRSGHEMGGYVKVMCKNCKDGLSTKYEVAPDGSALPETPEPAEQKASQADSRSDSDDSTERSGRETTCAQALRVEPVGEALQWYATHVAGCRKLSMIGDPHRALLDNDGGARARAALKALDASRLSQADSRSDEKGEGRCARALAELVACKDLIDPPRADPYGDRNTDYHRRKGPAWAEARAAIEALKSDEGDLGVTLRGGAKTTGGPGDEKP